MPTGDDLKRRYGKRATPPAPTPLWKGPEKDGVTFSMLSRFLQCPERFRVDYIDGLRPVSGFNHLIEYGQMWHACEEGLASVVASKEGGHIDCALANLETYCRQVCRRYPMQQEQILHWYNVCKIQFPIYVAYWARNDDVVARTPLMQEQVFDVPYKLQNGRTVRLRGKFDAVDMIGKGRNAKVFLQENKTKGQVIEQQLRRQLRFDLQTMMYLSVLHRCLPELVSGAQEQVSAPVAGVRYNVVRRPLSGGEGSIRQRKGETLPDFYARLRGIIEESPQGYFWRWKVDVKAEDVAAFRWRCLDPLLYRVCEWWDWITSNEVAKHGPYHDGGGWGVHWQHPYGVRNILDEGGSTDLDEYLETGSTVGLVRLEELFEELKLQ